MRKSALAALAFAFAAAEEHGTIKRAQGWPLSAWPEGVQPHSLELS